jgi:hypothetical protein
MMPSQPSSLSPPQKSPSQKQSIIGMCRRNVDSHLGSNSPCWHPRLVYYFNIAEKRKLYRDCTWVLFHASATDRYTITKTSQHARFKGPPNKTHTLSVFQLASWLPPGPDRSPWYVEAGREEKVEEKRIQNRHTRKPASPGETMQSIKASASALSTENICYFVEGNPPKTLNLQDPVTWGDA